MHIRAFADDKLREKLAHVVNGMTKWGHFTVYDLCDFGRKSSKQALVVFNGWSAMLRAIFPTMARRMKAIHNEIHCRQSLRYGSTAPMLEREELEMTCVIVANNGQLWPASCQCTQKTITLG